jgi:putative Ca2+/H+ antiporter (TMEM165/GDT1 family)
MSEFFQSLFFITVAEMGDKSQLAALAFATRFRAYIVLGGIFAATLLVHLFSVILGELLGLAIPEFWVAIAAGIAFIGFGIWTLRGDEFDEDSKGPPRFGPFLTVGITFFIAELGDKTMLATVTLASHLQSFVAVWIGSTVGMVVADAIAIVVGIVLGKRLPERAIKYGAAAIFIGTGVATIVMAFL